MATRVIQPGESLERVFEELSFTQAALLGKPQTAALAKTVEPVLEKVLSVRNEQWKLWQEEMAALAGVVSINYVLDETVLDISEAKLDALREENPGWRDKQAKDSEEYEGYFPVPISAITKLQPEAQLIYMKPWQAALSREKFPPLQALLTRLDGEIKQAEEVLKKREDAQSATAMHRLKKIEPLIAEVNQFRAGLYAELLKLSQQHKFPKTWAAIFFRAAPQGAMSTDEVRGMTRALLLLIQRRGFVLTEEQQKKIAKETELSHLETWLSRAVTASSVESILS